MSNLHLQHRVGVRCVILGHAVAVALGVAATAAHADMFDFEDLPSLRATDPQGGYEPLGPNFAYHGFTFSAVHNVAGSQNSWWYVNVPESEQDPPYNWLLEGLPWAVQSGEFAIRSGNDYHNTQSVFAVSRTGGGLWTMDGAWFTRTMTNAPWNPGLTMSMIGYVGETPVYIYQQPIFHGIRTFVAPPGIAIDRLRIAMDWAPSTDIGFYMDDFQFTVVPAPSVIGQLCLAGLLRRRRRRE
jgi:hypothetical protein